ncbi:MAG TPA: NfeD family protein [Gammaproteobacteria bacterium]|nr:NfeD family protein [Gammaproteobacteria bacterium]
MGYTISLVFLAAGIVFAVLEMATLTFYLAALSFAALTTALASWLYQPNGWQAALVFAVASVVALPLAHLLRLRMQGSKADPLADMDKGAHVTVAQITGGQLKVKYRDSLWEAVWEGSGTPQVGQRAEVAARDGARLRIKSVN